MFEAEGDRFWCLRLSRANIAEVLHKNGLSPFSSFKLNHPRGLRRKGTDSDVSDSIWSSPALTLERFCTHTTKMSSLFHSYDADWKLTARTPWRSNQNCDTSQFSFLKIAHSRSRIERDGEKIQKKKKKLNRRCVQFVVCKPPGLLQHTLVESFESHLEEMAKRLRF